jgi:hypothetical protein
MVLTMLRREKADSSASLRNDKTGWVTAIPKML